MPKTLLTLIPLLLVPVLAAQTPQEIDSLYQQAFRGQRTDEAARDLEFRIAALQQQPYLEAAPQVVELLGGLAGMYFAAHREADAESVLRRLYAYARKGPDDTLLYAGTRKCLAVPAFRRFARRSVEVKVLEKLRRDLEGRARWNTKLMLDERFLVALMDCVGTAHMLDRRGAEALAAYREARARGDAVHASMQAPNSQYHQAATMNCRIFPRCGMISSYLILGEMEAAIEVQEELSPILEELQGARLLASGHPAYQAAEGALRSLKEGYENLQAARKLRGEDVPLTLEERRARRAESAAWVREADARARERVRTGEAPVSPFAAGAAPAASGP